MKLATSTALQFFIFSAVLVLAGGMVHARDERLVGFWERTNTTDPSGRWTINATGESTFDVDFGPEIPGFVLRTIFTWNTDSANKVFTYTVTRQKTLGPGPYSYDKPVPNKTYSEPYTLTGGTSGLWHIGQYDYAKKTASSNTIYDAVHVLNFWDLSGSGLAGDHDDIGMLAQLGIGAYSGATINAFGHLFMSDSKNHKIRKVSPDGRVTTFAGTGSPGNTNGPANQATFNSPSGMDFDENGNLYVAESGNRMIRKITRDGTVTTLAGSGEAGSANGAGADASFSNPEGLAVATDGRIWVADSGNNMIRRISPDGHVTSYGTGRPESTPETGGLGSPSTLSFAAPFAVETDSVGHVFVAERTKIRIYDGISWKTYAGADQAGDNDGGAAQARFRSILGMTWTEDLGLLVTDGSRIRLVTPYGVFTVAGSETSGNAAGIGRYAKFKLPAAMASDNYGSLYVLDAGSFKVKKGGLPRGTTPQSIVFSAITNKPVNAQPFALKASASSGLPVTVMVVRGPATVNGTMVTLTGKPGQVVIHAIQEGNGTYAAADPVNRTFTVAAPQVGAPVITHPPANASIPPGGSAQLNVSADGAGLSYQWYEGYSGFTGNPVAGAKSSSLVTPALRENTSFWVRVSNSLGSADSPTAVVRVPSVSASVNHRLFVRADGVAFASGANNFGSLGDGTTENRISPVPVMSGVSSVCAARTHSFFLKDDGSLWACGSDGSGAFGRGSTDGAPQTTPIEVATGVIAVASGEWHSLRLKADGTVWAAGIGSGGALGDGTSTDRTSPIQVMSGVKAIFAGNSSSFFLKTDGTLWATGDNQSGQLGDGTTTRRFSPVKVMSQVSKVASLYSHTLFLKTDGTAWACGNNAFGQLGDGTKTSRTTPVQVMSGVRDVQVGGGSFFIMMDGTTLGVGRNDFGQLGDGTFTNRPSPVELSPMIASASADILKSFFIAKDGTFWATGQWQGIPVDGVAPTIATPRELILDATVPAEAPRDIVLSNNTIGTTAGADSVVGSLATIDPDGGTHTYSLVPGAGSSGNLGFDIQGNQLRAYDPAGLAPGIHTVRIQVIDENGRSISKPFAIAVGGAEFLTDNSIAFDDVGDRFYPSAPFLLHAKAGSGLPVSFRVLFGPATISGSTVSLTGIGTVVVVANQSGNSSYSAARPVLRVFTVTRASSISTLSKLAVQGATLSPVFTPSTRTYTAKTGHSTKSIKITPTAKSDVAKIAVNGVAVKSGTSKAIKLKVGKNVISIVVTAQDGSKRTYNLTVTRRVSANSATSGLAALGLEQADRITASYRTGTSVVTIGGLRYLALEIHKTAGHSLLKPRVEVSSNLVDWFSGTNHTTVVADDAAILRVRDNTPLMSGYKRYIRASPEWNLIE